MSAGVREPHVCVIGASYIGAVLAAYLQSPPRGMRMSFLGCGIELIEEIAIRNGAVANVPFTSEGASLTIADYDIFVIYADMKTPHEMVSIEQYLTHEAYSAQVRTVSMIDLLSTTFTHRMGQMLKRQTAAPIYYLTQNIPLDIMPLQYEAQYQRGVALLLSLVDLTGYIEFPRALFAEGFVPRARFHKESVHVGGEVVDSASYSGHDNAHLNPLGGKLVLDQIVSRLASDGHLAAAEAA